MSKSFSCLSFGLKMSTCDICSRKFKNRRSLSTHRYNFHNSKKRTLDQLTNVTERQQHQKTVNISAHSTNNMQKNGAISEVKPNITQDDAITSFENSITSDNTNKSKHSDSCKKCVKRQKKRSSYKTYKNDFRDDDYNFDDYFIWIRALCLCILNRLIHLRKDHIDVLKTHEEFIRKVAHEKIKDAKKTMLTNPYALEIVLNTIVPLLTDCFEVVL